MKIHVVGGNNDYASWMDGETTESMEEADLFVFTGGTDVNPALYGEPRNPMTQPSDIPRDEKECFAFNWARDMKKPMVGICRGAQFLCVMAGGKLIQHQDNTPMHEMNTTFGEYVTVTSDHHQAAFPWMLGESKYRVLGWTRGVSKFHLDGNGKEMCTRGIEVEDAYYRYIRALAIQSHPEWLARDCSTVDYYRGLIRMLTLESL